MVADDRVAADAVAGVYGGESESVGPSSSGFEVVTRSDSVMIVVPGREAVLPGMVLGGHGQLFHACEGATASDMSCGACASTGEGRREAAWTGQGARPRSRSRLRFGLVELPDLGPFEIASSSWDFAESLIGLGAVFDDAADEVRGVLRLETVGFTTLSGIAVSYRKPVLEWGAGRGVVGRGALGLAA
ncbi:hypothetical protein NMG29_14370 [Streptomyces cocklensis]|nr:hypothetical protein [Actinacidiphila cocklensis]MDD1059380.1 hypothetical protein [Actinacidiphila cocklensis]